jgi:hypothetical protein
VIVRDASTVPGFDQDALTPFSSSPQRLVNFDQSASPLLFNTKEHRVRKTPRQETGHEQTSQLGGVSDNCIGLIRG